MNGLGSFQRKRTGCRGRFGQSFQHQPVTLLLNLPLQGFCSLAIAFGSWIEIISAICRDSCTGVAFGSSSGCGREDSARMLRPYQILNLI